MLKDLPQNTRITLLLNNRMGAAHMADAYSAVQLLSALFFIPAGYLAGALYAYRPGVAILGSGAVLLAAAVPLLRKETSSVPETALSNGPGKG